MLVQQRNYGELSTFSTYLEEQLVEALTRIEAVSQCAMHVLLWPCMRMNSLHDVSKHTNKHKCARTCMLECVGIWMHS
jgi:hypothetical protein